MKLVPYGKPLYELLLEGKSPGNSVYVYVGKKSWEKGQKSSSSRPTQTLVLPPHHLPQSYKWPVQGCEILLIETSNLVTEYIEDVVQVLFDYDANRVALLSLNLLLTIYEKEF